MADLEELLTPEEEACLDRIEDQLHQMKKEHLAFQKSMKAFQDRFEFYIARMFEVLEKQNQMLNDPFSLANQESYIRVLAVNSMAYSVSTNQEPESISTANQKLKKVHNDDNSRSRINSNFKCNIHGGFRGNKLGFTLEGRKYTRFSRERENSNRIKFRESSKNRHP